MYFERAAPSGSFVEVDLVEATLVRRWGRITALRTDRVQQRVEDFPNSQAATLALDYQVRGLEGKGYTVGHQHPALQRAVEREPDAPGPYLVYADWLLEQQDPRGELVSLMSRANPPSKKIEALFESYAPLLRPRWWQGHATLGWRLGFVQKMTFHIGPRPLEAHWFLRRILAHPSARFVRELTIDGSPHLDTQYYWRELLSGRSEVLQTVHVRGPTLEPLAKEIRGLVNG